MIENSKIIPEAEEALEHSLMMSSPQPKFNFSSLKEVAKDVDKLIVRLPFNQSQLQYK